MSDVILIQANSLCGGDSYIFIKLPEGKSSWVREAQQNFNKTVLESFHVSNFCYFSWENSPQISRLFAQ